MAGLRRRNLLAIETVGWWSTVLIFCVFAGANSSTYSGQSHEGSAPTNEFLLSASTPNARILVGSSSTIVVINVEPPTKSHKVSVELLAMQLCDGRGDDRLKIVYSDPTSIKTVVWKMNVTTTDEDRKELKDIQANQIVLIPEGRWVLSGANLVATLYQDAAVGEFPCPEGTFGCSCTSRCIAKELTCNGNPNCGLGCVDDESEKTCPGSSSSTDMFPSTVTDPCEKPLVPSTSTSTTEKDRGNDSGGGVDKANIVNVLFMILISYVVFK